MASRLSWRICSRARLVSRLRPNVRPHRTALWRWRGVEMCPLTFAVNRSYSSDGGARRYAKSHEWVCMNDKIATMGLSDYAQDKLGDIVFVDLPDVGAEFGKGDLIATLESVKAAADLYSPVDCKVVELNDNLNDSPEFINKDPYGEGWIAKLEVADEANCGLENLLSEEDYQKMLEEEES